VRNLRRTLNFLPPIGSDGRCLNNDFGAWTFEFTCECRADRTSYILVSANVKMGCRERDEYRKRDRGYRANKPAMA
jgi:hypothetical protein